MQVVLKAHQNGPIMQAVLKPLQNGPNMQAALNIHRGESVQKEKQTLGGPNPNSVICDMIFMGGKLWLILNLLQISTQETSVLHTYLLYTFAKVQACI